MGKTYKISVVLCIFNEEDSIINALKSLKSNILYSDTEVIVVDDCSTNEATLKILERLERFTDIKIIKSKLNLGLSNSRNLGFQNSTTELILPLDADDEFPESTIDLIYKTFEENPKIDFIVGNYYLNDIEHNKINLVRCNDISTDNFIDAKKLSVSWKLLGTSPCRKNVWKKIGGYSLDFSYSVQDVDFWIRAVQAKFVGLYLDYPIYKWNRSASGMNMNFDRFDMIKLLENHIDFYQLSLSKKHIYNKIFNAHYPYKKTQTLLGLGKRYFYHLTWLNKLRTAYIFMVGK